MAKKTNMQPRTISTQASMNKAIKSLCDILRRDKAKGARLYVPELTWMLFLCYWDILEQQAEQRRKALGLPYTPTLPAPYRWRDWAAPYDKSRSPETVIGEKQQGWKRCALDAESTGAFLNFVKNELFPYLKNLKTLAGATQPQKVVGEIFSNKDNTVVSTTANLQDVLDRIHALAQAQVDEKHMFPISQAFEGLLPSLGEKANDGGQFFTPREVIRLIVEVVNPKPGGKVYDPCCGTGGFLIEAYKHMMKQNPSAGEIAILKTDCLFGREDAEEAIPILLANMVLHDIEQPRIWHGNTLTQAVSYGDLWAGAPSQFDYILTNPPFGSKEGKAAQARFAYKTGKAQILFLQEILQSLKDGGVCGMVIDEGVLFHTKTAAYTQVKRKLLNECNLFCIVSLPGGVFVNAGAGVKTDLLFFKKGEPTERIWYYDMTLNDDFLPRKVNKGNPLNFEHFADFLHRLRLKPDDPGRISERSWYMTRQEAEAKEFDLKAVNNNAPDFSDKRMPSELLKIIEEAQAEITKGLKVLMQS